MEHRQTRTVVTDPQGVVKEASTSVGQGQESFVEIAQNAKGEPRVTVKCYHTDIETALNDAITAYYRALKMLERMDG